jgi:hypothetical protein
MYMTLRKENTSIYDLCIDVAANRNKSFSLVILIRVAQVARREARCMREVLEYAYGSIK